MSNWLTVRLTASRSSARSAPISYTPPVKPPPPRTRAVRERRVRRRRGFPRVPEAFFAGFWSLTTSPIHLRVSRMPGRTAPAAPLRCSFLPMRRALVILLAIGLLLPVGAAEADLRSSLTRQMRQAGSSSGAFVTNLSTGERVFAWRARTPRILASNTKLFTSAAALARFGTEGTLGTEVLGAGTLDADGIWRGDLYLRGGGDPSFGSSALAQLAGLLEDVGIERVTGRVYGDESRHDSLRGGPDSSYGVSIWVGPLSALSFNEGRASSGFQVDPPAFAAARLDGALEARGITVRLRPRAAAAPEDGEVLASVDSPPMETLVQLMNKPSHNFFAEILAKDLAMQAGGQGTTPAGARVHHGLPPAARRRARAHPGARPLPRQDGHAVERELALGLLRGTVGRHLRLLDPDEPRLHARCPGAPGPDAAGDRRRELALALGEQRQQALLVEHLGADLLRLRQLRAGILAGHQVVRLL